MNKTWKWILIGGGVLLALYLIFAKSSPVKLGSGARANTSSTAQVIEASGHAAGGLATLWGSIFGKDGEDEG
jgi:hypothetical protein